MHNSGRDIDYRKADEVKEGQYYVHAILPNRHLVMVVKCGTLRAADNHLNYAVSFLVFIFLFIYFSLFFYIYKFTN